MKQLTIDKIKQISLPILKAAGVTRSSLFGSYVRGEQNDNSDIDVLVELPKHATLLDMVGIKLDLEEKLKRKVDVVEYEGLKPRIKASILQQQIQIL